MSRNLQCKKVNELPGYEQARLWWRSRLPEEKTALLTTREYLFFPTIVISVPVPFENYITIVRTNENYRSEKIVLLRSQQADLLRSFYKKCNSKGWTVQRGKNCVVFIRPGRVVKVDAPRAERFLWS